MPENSPIVEKVNPEDEFPIKVQVYCKIKHIPTIHSNVFQKAMNFENKYKKFYIKEWDSKYAEFFGRKV